MLGESSSRIKFNFENILFKEWWHGWHFIQIATATAICTSGTCTGTATGGTGATGATTVGKGLPLGNLTSQLLVNIYMNEFDQFLMSGSDYKNGNALVVDQWVKHTLKAQYYIRYADDFCFFSTDRRQLADIVRLTVLYLRASLKLELHPRKVSIATVASGVDFLGWVHFPHCRTLRTVTKRRMLKHVQKKPVNPASVQSYLGLLRHGDTYRLRDMLESLSI